MNSPRKLMTLSAMALALVLPACSESGMRANQEKAEVPAGTQLYVRVNQNTSSNNQGWKIGDEFQGTLARALQVDGRVIAPEGTIVKGDLTDKIDTADNTGMTAGSATTSDNRAGDTHDRMGLELKKIVLNGDEYEIDTHAVPIPGMMASQNEGPGYGSSSTAKDRGADTHMMDKDSMAKAQIAGQEFLFTLEDEVDLPSTTNMKTE